MEPLIRDPGERGNDEGRRGEVKHHVVVILRWCAVLPGAIVGASVARVVVLLGNLLTYPFGELDFLAEVGFGLIAGVGFMLSLGYCGAWIAPAHKRATGIVLTVGAALVEALLLALIVVAAVLALSAGDVPIPNVRAICELVGGLVAAVYIGRAGWRGEDVWSTERGTVLVRPVQADHTLRPMRVPEVSRALPK